jgi:hypothetical protein
MLAKIIKPMVAIYYNEQFLRNNNLKINFEI